MAALLSSIFKERRVNLSTLSVGCSVEHEMERRLMTVMQDIDLSMID